MKLIVNRAYIDQDVLKISSNYIFIYCVNSLDINKLQSNS